MEYIKTLVFFEDDWFFSVLSTALLGYIIPVTMYKMTKEGMEKLINWIRECFNKGKSYWQIFLSSLFVTCGPPFVISLCILGGFAISDNKHGLEAFILCLLFSFIPTIKCINDVLKKYQKEVYDNPSK